MLELLRNWWRGYTDDDVKVAHLLLLAWKNDMLKPGAITQVSRGQMKAIVVIQSENAFWI